MKRRIFAAAVAGLLLAASASLTAYAADQWYQYVCQKCGEKGVKTIQKNPVANSECTNLVNGKRCGGLKIDTPCDPPR